MKTELEELIREQRKDDFDFQPPEIHTVPLEKMIPFLSEEGLNEMPRANKKHPECHLHGREDIVASNNWAGWRCRVCYRIRSHEWAKRNRKRAAEWTKRWKKENPEKQREYHNKYRKNRYHTDPVWRQKEIDRKAEWRRRKRAEQAS